MNIRHAYGHDIHTASLLGAAYTLHSIQNTLRGNLLLIFQPAEETISGAKTILNSGVFDMINPDAFFSMLIMPCIPAGKVGTRSGSIMAAHI